MGEVWGNCRVKDTHLVGETLAEKCDQQVVQGETMATDSGRTRQGIQGLTYGQWQVWSMEL